MKAYTFAIGSLAPLLISVAAGRHVQNLPLTPHIDDRHVKNLPLTPHIDDRHVKNLPLTPHIDARQTGNGRPTSYEALYFDQKIDHFPTSDRYLPHTNETFKQTYYVDNTYYKPGMLYQL